MVEATNNKAGEESPLHEQITARWEGPDRLGAGATTEPMVSGRIDSLIASLPGLASLSAGFGAQAFDIASLMAMESRFSYALSPDLRAMSIGDLADIVQIVLEEEESTLDALEAQVRLATTNKARAVAVKRLQAAQSSQPKRNKMGQQRRVDAVRQAIKKVRAEAARVRTSIQSDTRTAGEVGAAGVDQPARTGATIGMDPTGVSKSDALGTLGPADPGVLPGIGESLRILSLQAHSGSTPQSRTSAAAQRDVTLSAADFGSSVTADHTASRALRIAEWTADMAVLQPGTDAGWGADASVVSGPDAPARQVLDAYAEVSTPHMVPSEHRAALARAQRVVAQRAVQQQQTDRRVAAERSGSARRLAAGPSAAGPSAAGPSVARQASRTRSSADERRQPTMATFAPRLALLRAIAANQRAAVADATDGSIAAFGGPDAAPHAVDAAVAPSQGVAGRFLPAGAGAFAGRMPALAGAVGLSAATLQRLDRGMRIAAASPRNAVAEGGSPAAGAAQGEVGLERATFAADGVSPATLAPRSLWDRFSTLLDPKSASPAGLGGAMQRWVDASDAMLGGARAEPRWYDAPGAGETLRIAADAGPRAADDGLRAGAPAWIAPQRRRMAAQKLSAAGAASKVGGPVAARQSPVDHALPAATAAALGRRADRVVGDAAAEAATPARFRAERFGLAGGIATVPAQLAVGSAAVGAFHLATQLGARHFGGLMPSTTPQSWMPTSPWMPQSILSPVVASPATAATPIGGATELQMLSGLTGIPVESLSRMGPAAVAQMRGALADQAGAGEWLLPGDDGYETWTAKQDAQGERPTSRPPRTALGAAGTARGATAGRPQIAAQPVPQGAAAVGAVTHAAAAAIKHVLASHERAAKAGLKGGAQLGTQTEGLGTAKLPRGERSLLAFANGGAEHLTQSALGVAPGGLSDAVTPWILQRAMERMAPESRRSLMLAATGGGDLLSLDTADTRAGFDATAAGPVASGEATAGVAQASATVAASVGVGAQLPAAAAQVALQNAAAQAMASLSPAHRTLLARLTSSGKMATGSLLGGAALDLREPMALRAALALFGEQSTATGDVGDAFLARFFGRQAAAESRAVGGEMTALAAGPDVRSIGRSGPVAAGVSSLSSGETSPDHEVVFSGLAGLQALREMKGADVADKSLVDLGRVEAGDKIAASASPRTATRVAASAGDASAAAKGGTAAQIHRFAPVGLARTRQLLEGRRGDGRISARRSRFGRGRVGYGAAGLGGGALLGLMPSDGGGLTETYGGTAASRRAERLGAAVEARRAPRPGQVLRPMPHGGTERTYVSAVASGASSAGASPQRGGYVGSAAAGFGGTSELVSPMAAMQAAASAGNNTGGTAAAKSQQAGAMARVLSVTASPSANVLPLVAPAARALVARAAAKPMSESISTSGANATASLSLAGQDVDGQQAGGSGMGAGAQDRQDAGGQPSQELNALAMKVARSVLVRIKRERERRGIHG